MVLPGGSELRDQNQASLFKRSSLPAVLPLQPPICDDFVVKCGYWVELLSACLPSLRMTEAKISAAIWLCGCV